MKPIITDQEELVKENFRYPRWLQKLVVDEAASRICITTKSDIIREALIMQLTKKRKKSK